MSRKTYGLRAWLWQRVSSVGIALYLLALGLVLLIHPPAGYTEWRDWMSNTGVGLATALFFGAVLVHAWIGTRDIVMDYVHVLWLRWLLLGALGAMLAASGFWVLGVIYALH